MRFNRKKFAKRQAFRLLRYSSRLQSAKESPLTIDDCTWLENHLPIFDEFHLCEALRLIEQRQPDKAKVLAERYKRWVAPSLRCACANILGEKID